MGFKGFRFQKLLPTFMTHKECIRIDGCAESIVPCAKLGALSRRGCGGGRVDEPRREGSDLVGIEDDLVSEGVEEVPTPDGPGTAGLGVAVAAAVDDVLEIGDGSGAA